MAERPDENRPTTPPPPPQRAGYVAAPGKPATPSKDQPDHATPAGQGSRPAGDPQSDRKTQSETSSKAPASSAASPAPQAAASGKASHKTARQASRGSRLARLFFAVAVIGVVGFFGVIAAGATGYALIAREIPDPSQLQQRQSTFASTKIYDRNGNLLVELTDPTNPTAGRRTYVRLDQINPSLIQATLATEDPNFYRYSVGFDPIALVRIVYYAITERDFVSGGSTITQQVARNLLLDPAERQSRSLMRKIREIILANELARRYSRDTILEIYLNEINYGNLAYGIEAASQTYFGKPAKDLNLAEASLLAGLPQAPSYWDPVAHKDRALRRQRDVLRLMTQAGYIGGNQAAAASAEIEAKVFDVRPPNISNVAPHFMNYVRQLLDDEFGSDGLYRVGLRVYTTLDPRVQSIAEQTVKEQVAKLADKHVTNGAVVAMDPRTGEVLAMVGSADFDNEQIDGQVNVALAPRQPGSSIKPFTYLAAFEKGHTPATLFWDAPSSYTNEYGQVYTPRNYDGKFHGPMLLREALARSMNIPAVETMSFVGVPGFLELTERAGVHFPPNDQYGLALTLGGGEARLLDLTTGYATLANAGAQVKPTAIRRVELADGQVVHDYLQSPERSQVIAPEHAYLITSILSDNDARAPSFGRNSALKLSRPAAVKTGTTNDFRDNLTVGYTPELAVGVWVGNSDNSPMNDVSGITGAAPIWHDVMEKSLEGQPPTPFERPPGVVEAEICLDGGHAPAASCPPDRRRIEIFKSGQEPLPPDEVVERAAREQNRDLLTAPPPPATQSEIVITQPANGSAIERGLLSIRGTVNPGGFQSYQVEYGDGDAPGQWQWISGPHLSPVVDDQLTQWGTEGLPSGRYTIKVTAFTSNGPLEGFTHFDVGP